MKSPSICPLTDLSVQRASKTLVDEFVANLRCNGFKRKFVESGARTARHLLVWLQQEEIPLQILNGVHLCRFLTHD